jgi:hypothetical protein
MRTVPRAARSSPGGSSISGYFDVRVDGSGAAATFSSIRYEYGCCNLGGWRCRRLIPPGKGYGPGFRRHFLWTLVHCQTRPLWLTSTCASRGYGRLVPHRRNAGSIQPRRGVAKIARRFKRRVAVTKMGEPVPEGRLKPARIRRLEKKYPLHSEPRPQPHPNSLFHKILPATH